MLSKGDQRLWFGFERVAVSAVCREPARDSLLADVADVSGDVVGGRARSGQNSIVDIGGHNRVPSTGCDLQKQHGQRVWLRADRAAGAPGLQCTTRADQSADPF